jgi:hypothetical protein
LVVKRYSLIANLHLLAVRQKWRGVVEPKKKSDAKGNARQGVHEK